jgi:hypothetical protein
MGRAKAKPIDPALNKGQTSKLMGFASLCPSYVADLIIDETVKSTPGRHSREGGSPEPFEIPGFPFSRE